MKRFLFILFMILVPSLTMAQASGGQIRRKPQTSISSKPSRSSSAKNKPTTPKMSEHERKTIIANIVNNMVYVEGGTFTMGATSEQGSDARSYEEPAHQVTLYSFSIGKYEVTQEEWLAVMGNNPSRFKGAKCPVESVSWNDCQEFIRRLNNITGKRFRLPTEAEWEYAARGGNKSQGFQYSGSNNIDLVGWYSGNSEHKIHNVGQLPHNELGLHDMSGNVNEWCQDWYGNYDSNSQTNPIGPSTGIYHVWRGGSWGGWWPYCRVSWRNGSLRDPSAAADARSDNIGLRLAM